jgi:hypothetical protein
MRSPSTASAFLALVVALLLTAAAPAGAAIYYRTSTSVENAGGSTSIAMTVPSGVAVGDFLVADVDATGTAAITPPAGWNQLISSQGVGSTFSVVHWRLATAADVAGASYTWSLGTSRKAVGRLTSYVGVDTSSIGTPAVAGTTGTTITFTGVTTPVANSLVLLGGTTSVASGTVSLTPPAGTTTRVNLATTGGGAQIRGYNGDFIQATAGATGNKTGTISPSTTWGSAMFWVKPAAGTLAFDVVPDAGTLPGVTLNGQAQTTTSQMSDFAVDDTTGSSSGWNVTSAGDGTGGKSAVLKQYCTQAGGCASHPFGYVTGGQTLPAGSLKLTSTGASFTGANGTAPAFQCSAGCTLDSAAPTKVAAAAAGGAGLGPWQTTGLSATSLSLSTATTLRALPANEVYRADLLWTLSSGP